MPPLIEDSCAAFAKTLEGPAVHVILGSAPASCVNYVLPQALLVRHSLFFMREIERLQALHCLTVSTSTSVQGSPQEALPEANVEAPATPVSDPPSTRTLENQFDTAIMSADTPVPKILIWTRDPQIFSLFLAFLYYGFYRPFYTGPLPVVPLQGLPSQTIPTPSHNTTLAAMGIPPPIIAYTLGVRLFAPAFMDHSMEHIYRDTGRHFSLTPTLVSIVFRHPWTLPRQPHEAPAAGTGIDQQPGLEHSARAAGLRAFILDVLTQYWTAPTPHVTREPRQAWEALFDALPELRREFIFGLQDRKVGPLTKYLATPQPPIPASHPHPSATSTSAPVTATAAPTEVPTAAKDGNSAAKGSLSQGDPSLSRTRYSLPTPIRTPASTPPASVISAPPPRPNKRDRSTVPLKRPRSPQGGQPSGALPALTSKTVTAPSSSTMRSNTPNHVPQSAEPSVKPTAPASVPVSAPVTLTEHDIKKEDEEEENIAAKTQAGLASEQQHKRKGHGCEDEKVQEDAELAGELEKANLADLGNPAKKARAP